MSGEPLVSIVTIFHNAERFFVEAIQSVLNQTYRHWELILVDDGSTDGSAAIVGEYCERHPRQLRRLAHPGHANRGMSASRNLGIRSAVGDFIAFLDADDVWLPRKLERQLALFDAHQNAAMVFGAAKYWHGWTGKAEDVARDSIPALGIEPDRLYDPPALTRALYPLGAGTAPCPSDLMVRRDLVERLGGFEDCYVGSYQLYEDQAFLAKVYLEAPVYISSETWIKYRIHPDSCSSAVARAGRYREVRRYFLGWLEGYLRNSSVDDRDIWAALRKAARELRADEARTWWKLRIAGGAVADLINRPGDPSAVRIEITTTPVTGAGFDVQLNLPHLPIEAGREYAIRFAARSDSPRGALVGIARSRAPWTGLGWHHHLQLAPEWQTFEATFQPSAGEPDARVHFDVGESPVPIEIKSFGLFRMPEETRVEPVDPSHASDTLLGGLRRVSPVSRNWGFERGLPIDRYYIEKFLEHHSSDIHGRVLEIEDDMYTRRYGGGRVTASDVLHVTPGNSRATVVGDLTHAPQLESEAFDAIVLTQTLHLIYDTRAALRTLHRILKPGGVLLATFPGLSKVSGQEWRGSWFWGFTTASAQRLFEEAFEGGRAEVAAFGNVLTAIAFLHGLAAEELHHEELEYCDPEYELLIAVRARKAVTTP